MWNERKKTRDRAHAVAKRRDVELPVWQEAIYEHIARRVLAHHPVSVIAQAVGWSTRQTRRHMRSPKFQEVYDRIKLQLYGTIDEVMYDQRADLLDRYQAGGAVALSTVFDLIENARSERVKGDMATHVLGVLGHTPVQKKVAANLTAPQLDDAQIDKLTQALAVAQRDIVQGEAEVVDVG